jgi:hypothetical protein
VLHILASHFDAEGNLLWQDDDFQPNVLHDEGELYILARVFRTNQSNYTNTINPLYLGVDNRTSLSETDTLASLSGEPTTGGYARKGVNTDGTTTGSRPYFKLSQPSSYYQASLATTSDQDTNVSWTPNANWSNAVSKAFLCTHVSATTSGADQRLIASVALSASRQVNNGDTLTLTFTLGLHE